MTRKSKTLILEERLEIEKLIKKGFSGRQIAKTIGRSVSCVAYELRKFRSNQDYDALEAHKKQQDQNEKKYISRRKELTDEQKHIIAEGVAKGWPINKIGDACKLFRETIKTYIHTTNLETTAIDNQSDLETRIKSLEFQVEILTDIIRRQNERIVKD